MSRRINIWFSIDWLSILIFLALLVIGWISIYSALYDENHHSIFDYSQRYGKQFVWIIAAILLAAAIVIIDSKFFPFFAYLFYGFAIVLLVGVLFFGVEVNASKSWFQFGNVNIQPAEFAKLATALALAQYMSQAKKNTSGGFPFIIPIILVTIPSFLILLQPDVGSAIVFLTFILVFYREGMSSHILFLGIIFLALSVIALLVTEITILLIIYSIGGLAFFLYNHSPLKLLLAILIHAGFTVPVLLAFRFFSPDTPLDIQLVISSIAACIFFILYSRFKRVKYGAVIASILLTAVLYTWSVDYVFDNLLMPHQRSRINIVLGIEDDPAGQGYNINQSKIAIGSGGLTGKGFLQGTQTKFNFVPEQSTDFIFCTIGEEWGFTGSLVVMLLFVILLLRLVYLAERQRSAFARIYGYGLISILLFHVVVNIGMTIGLVPVIGIPLPFISYGGSSMWAFTMMLFIFLQLDARRMEFLR